MLPVSRPGLRAWRPAAVPRAATTGPTRLKPHISILKAYRFVKQGHLLVKGNTKSLSTKFVPLPSTRPQESARRTDQAYQYAAWIVDQIGLYWLYTSMIFMCVTWVALLLQVSVHCMLLLSWSVFGMGDNLYDIGQGSASLYHFFQVYCN
jgi:hypothetical protein